MKLEQEAFGIYHVYNRGVRKDTLFHSNSDYSRFLLLIFMLQYTEPVQNISRLNKVFSKNLDIKILDQKDKGERLIELLAFCIMPNHFHILGNQLIEDGLAKYMQKVLTAYTMYYNKKYKKTGHAFQGKYKKVFVEDDEQLVYTSIYIHKNSLDVGIEPFSYTWSSLQDLVGDNRWADFLNGRIIMDHYGGDLSKYKTEVIESPAKIISKKTIKI